MDKLIESILDAAKKFKKSTDAMPDNELAYRVTIISFAAAFEVLEKEKAELIEQIYIKDNEIEHLQKDRFELMNKLPGQLPGQRGAKASEVLDWARTFAKFGKEVPYSQLVRIDGCYNMWPNMAISWAISEVVAWDLSVAILESWDSTEQSNLGRAQKMARDLKAAGNPIGDLVLRWYGENSQPHLWTISDLDTARADYQIEV